MVILDGLEKNRLTNLSRPLKIEKNFKKYKIWSPRRFQYGDQV